MKSMARRNYIKIKDLKGEVILSNFKDCIRVHEIAFSNIDECDSHSMGLSGIGQKYGRVYIVQLSDYIYTDLYGFQDPKTPVKDIFGYVTASDDNESPIIEKYYWKNCRFNNVRKDTSSGLVTYEFTYTWVQITSKSYDNNGKALSQKVKTHDVAAGTYS